MRSGAALVLDVLVGALLLAVLLIIVTGGGLFHVGGIRLSARSTGNPLLIALVLLAARLSISTRAPFGQAGTHARNFWDWAGGPIVWLDGIRQSSHGALLVRGILALCLAMIAIKLALAWAHPGFFSGDDVEIHEMSLGTLLGRDWPVWSLRNAFYPLGVVYPVQWTVHALGVRDPAALIFAGRAIVCLLSTFAILLTWKTGRRLWGDAAGYALLAAVLTAFNSTQVSFGSSELPRPVATVLVVLAFLALHRGGRSSAAAAGALIGTAAAFRYSEVTFLAAGVLHLAWTRQWTTAITFGLAGTIAAAIAIGTADTLYWGMPFYSLQQAIDFTLVDRLSSRGYQSVLWYATHISEWSSWPVVALALIGTARAPASLGIWAWLPILALSLLPHKEARYLVPSVPFVCLLAAFGVQALVEPKRGISPAAGGRRHAIVVVALVFGILQEAGDWRLRRTDADVALFRRVVIPQLAREDVVAVEQAWRIGGRLYGPPGMGVVDLDGERISKEELPAAEWVLLDAGTMGRAGLQEQLESSGYVEEGRSEESRYRVFRRQ